MGKIQTHSSCIFIINTITITITMGKMHTSTQTWRAATIARTTLIDRPCLQPVATSSSSPPSSSQSPASGQTCGKPSVQAQPAGQPELSGWPCSQNWTCLAGEIVTMIVVWELSTCCELIPTPHSLHTFSCLWYSFPKLSFAKIPDIPKILLQWSPSYWHLWWTRGSPETHYRLWKL